MTMTDTTQVSETRTIAAPADAIFALLADPTMHAEFDGSGMVQGAISSAPVGALGDTFVMSMHNDEMGPYEMANRVVEFEAGKRIAWEPALHKASRPQDQDEVGESAYQVWGFELAVVDARTTEVTETFDCSRSPEWLRRAVRGGERWRADMVASLERLDRLCTQNN